MPICNSPPRFAASGPTCSNSTQAGQIGDTCLVDLADPPYYSTCASRYEAQGQVETSQTSHPFFPHGVTNDQPHESPTTPPAHSPWRPLRRETQVRKRPSSSLPSSPTSCQCQRRSTTMASALHGLAAPRSRRTPTAARHMQKYGSRERRRDLAMRTARRRDRRQGTADKRA
jgi:hypothetical protein